MYKRQALAWLEGIGYDTFHGAVIAPGEPAAERDDYDVVFLRQRLQQALRRLNPDLPDDALDEAYRKLTIPETASLVKNNHGLHRMLVEGVNVEYMNSEGRIVGTQVKVLDFEEVENNEWLAVNQFTVTEGNFTRRPDVVVFVNGLPIAVFELKNAINEDTTIWAAYNQLQTYKKQVPSLFVYNEALVISDGLTARVGTITASREWFLPWRTIEGDEPADQTRTQLQVILEGLFNKRRFLDLSLIHI